MMIYFILQKLLIVLISSLLEQLRQVACLLVLWSNPAQIIFQKACSLPLPLTLLPWVIRVSWAAELCLLRKQEVSCVYSVNCRHNSLNYPNFRGYQVVLNLQPAQAVSVEWESGGFQRPGECLLAPSLQSILLPPPFSFYGFMPWAPKISKANSKLETVKTFWPIELSIYCYHLFS